MKINVKYLATDVNCRFVPHRLGLRMWITDASWYQSVGWCPHINLNGLECEDCALNVG